MKYLKLDYYYDPQKSLLCRIGLNESKHLLWSKGGVPCFNAEILDKETSEWIGVRTNKRRFVVKRNVFEDNKQTWDNHGEKQYFINLNLWDIKELK